MKSQKFTKLIAFTLVSAMCISLSGCGVLDKILEPEEKEYKSTMYKQTDNADKDFNTYDGVPETKEDKEDGSEENKEENKEQENLATKEEYVDNSPIKFSFDKTKEITVTDIAEDGYTITYQVPSDFLDVKDVKNLSKIDFELLNLQEKIYKGSCYNILSTDSQTIKLRNAIVSTSALIKGSKDTIISQEELVTISAKQLAEIKTKTNYTNIKENDINYLKVTRDGEEINIAYREYPYTLPLGDQEASIIIAAAPFGERYFVSEIWINSNADRIDYEGLLINMFGSVQIAPKKIQE